MNHLTHVLFRLGRSAVVTHPNSLLALATAFIFAVALGASWSTLSRAQDSCVGGIEGNCPGGTNYCLWSNAINPCASMGTTCYPTGTGCTCMVTGNPNPQPEGTYKMTYFQSPWQKCWGPGGGSSKSCTGSQRSCGTTKHYVSGYPSCSLSHPCVGNWYWASCWGAGDYC